MAQDRASETPGLSSSGLLDSSMGSVAMQEQLAAMQEQLAAESTPSLLEQLAAAPPAGSTPSMDGMFQPIKNPAPVMPADAWELNKMESGVMYGGSGVSPTAVDAWQRVIHGMIGGNEEVQKRMEENDARVHIIGRDNLLTDDFPDQAGGVTSDGCTWVHRLLRKVYGMPDEVRERAESVEVRTADTVEHPSP